MAKLKKKRENLFVIIKVDYFLIPDADKENSYNGGPKSMKVVGFMERSNVPFDLLVGEGSMVFQSNEDDAVSFSFPGFFLSVFHFFPSFSIRFLQFPSYSK